MTLPTEQETCRWFIQEGLLLVEQGRWMESPANQQHLNQCHECQNAQTDYHRLMNELTQLSEQDRPKLGWQSHVLRRVEKEARLRWFLPWVPWTGLAATAAAGLVWLVVLSRSSWSPVDPRFELTWSIVDSSRDLRGPDLHPGTRVQLRSNVPRELPHQALRLYRDDKTLVLTCPGDPSCRFDSAGISAEVELPAAGNYRALLITSELPLPTFEGTSLDGDAQAAYAMGAQVKTSLPMDVY